MMAETVAKPLTKHGGFGHARRMADKPDDVLSSAELARHYGVSRTRVGQWVDQGCPVVAAAVDPYTGRAVRAYFRVADVDAWRAANKERKGGRPKGNP